MMNLNTADMQSQEEAQSPAINQAQQQAAEDAALLNKNVAETLSKEKLIEIGKNCLEGFELDLKSRSDWEMCLQEWLDLANQTRENKTYPWPNASNVKYPLLSTAAMQFAARAYPSLVPSNGKIVKAIVIGKDDTGEKYEKGERVTEYMSYQVMHEMDNWEEDMDKMLMMLPVVGTVFKKTFYDKSLGRVASKMILPQNLVVNYWTKNLESCERISEIFQLSPRLLQERINQKIYMDVDLGDPQTPAEGKGQVTQDETTPYELVEQHTFLDLKDTGYAIPYIVTFDRVYGTVLRITPRFRIDDVEREGNKIVKVTPTQMYTKFGFVPNPDGGFYDIGFGILLGPLNESVNTIINQLVDAGSLSNLQSGFIGKGLRLKMGDARFQPGEWKPVNATGDDLRKQIVPLPAKEPSNVLFQLMGTLITSGKELASVAEIFVGKMPGQNTPATTTMASIEQGMKVFTAVYKRIFRSLSQEFKKIFELNATYMDPNTYVSVIDTQIGPEDFDKKSYDICPGADPTAVSQTEKLLKAQGLMELVGQMPQMFDMIEVVSRVLEAQEQPNWQKVFSQEVQQSRQLPPPPPDPKLMAIQAKMQADQQKAAVDIQAKQAKMELEGRSAEQKMAMEAQSHAQEMQQKEESGMLEAASKLAMSQIFAAGEKTKSQQTLVNKQQEHGQKMVHNEEVTKSKVQATKAIAAAKPTPSKKTG